MEQPQMSMSPLVPFLVARVRETRVQLDLLTTRGDTIAAGVMQHILSDLERDVAKAMM